MRVLTSKTDPSAAVAIDDEALDVMESRLRTVLSNSLDITEAEPKGTVTADKYSTQDNLPKGWSRVASRVWKPCPIGVYQQ